MDINYIKLFTNIAHTTEVLAEQVMDLNREKNDDKGLETSTIMREDYSKLYDKLRDPFFNPNSLTRPEFAKLLVGAIIISQQIENKIEKEQTALQGYKIDIIPKLERIVNETNTTEEALTLAEELLQVQDKKENEDK